MLFWCLSPCFVISGSTTFSVPLINVPPTLSCHDRSLAGKILLTYPERGNRRVLTAYTAQFCSTKMKVSACVCVCCVLGVKLARTISWCIVYDPIYGTFPAKFYVFTYVCMVMANPAYAFLAKLIRGQWEQALQKKFSGCLHRLNLKDLEARRGYLAFFPCTALRSLFLAWLQRLGCS